MRAASRIVGVVAGVVLALAALPAGVAAAADPCANNVAGVVYYDVTTSPNLDVCFHVGELNVEAYVLTVPRGSAPAGQHLVEVCYGPAPYPDCVAELGQRSASESVSPLDVDTEGWEVVCPNVSTNFVCLNVDGTLEISTEPMGAGGALVISGVIAVCVNTSAGGTCLIPFWNTVTIPLPPPII